MDFHEDPFPGSPESDKKVHCCSGKLIIKLNLRLF